MSRVLVVEDNPDGQYLLKRIFEAKGHVVTTADHGKQALKVARQNPPEIIVSDIMMPVMNGFKFCHTVKTDKRLNKIPFIFYTATFIEKRDVKLAMSLGASRFLIKPLDGNQLNQIIDQVLEEHRQGLLSVPAKTSEKEGVLLELFENSLAYKLNQKVEKT